jgi:hypothetical protein
LSAALDAGWDTLYAAPRHTAVVAVLSADTLFLHAFKQPRFYKSVLCLAKNATRLFLALPPQAVEG